MRKPFYLKSLGCVFLVLSACVPTSHAIYWKEGPNFAQRQSDFTDCEVEALNKVPNQTAVRSIPGYTTPIQVSPSSTQCYGYGNYASCNSSGSTVTGGQVIGGGVETYDANLGLRDRVGRQCLSRRGYTLVTLPVCTTAQLKGGLRSNSGKLPQVSKVACLSADKSAYVLK